MIRVIPSLIILTFTVLLSPLHAQSTSMRPESPPLPEPNAESIQKRDQLWDRAQKLAGAGTTAEAIRTGEQVLKLERQLYGETHAEITGTLQWLSQQHLKQKDVKTAEERAVELLSVQTAVHGKDHWQAVSARWYLDYVQKLAKANPDTLDRMQVIEAEYIRLFAQEKYAEAAAKIQELVPLEQRVLGEDHPFLANSLQTRADSCFAAADFECMATAADRCLAIRQQVFGIKHPDTAMAAWSVALSRIRQQRHEDALGPLELARHAWNIVGDDNNAAWMAVHHGDLLFLLEKYGAAQAAYESAHGVFRTINNDEGLGHCLNALGEVCRHLGHFRQAIDYQRQALDLIKKRLGDRHPSYAISLSNLGLAQRELHEYRVAEKAQSRALQILEDTVGTQDPIYATTLHNLAFLYEAMGRLQEAESACAKALNIKEILFGQKHPQYADSLQVLAKISQSRKQHSEAERLYKQVARIRKDAVGSQHTTYATALHNLAYLYRQMGDIDKSERHYLRAIEVDRSGGGERLPLYIESLNGLARLYEYMGNYARAEPVYLEVRDITHANWGEQSIAYSAALNNLALLYERMGKRNTVERLHLQSLSIVRESLTGKERSGRAISAYATSLNNYAMFCLRRGKYDESLLHSKRALSVERSVDGKDSANYATILNNISKVYMAMGDYQSAATHLLEAFRIRKSILGEMHPDFATTLEDLAHIYVLLGEYDLAEPLALRAYTITSESLGEEHPACIPRLNSLANLYSRAGQPAKAIEFAEKAVLICESKLGIEHPEFAVSVLNLASAYASDGSFEKASESYIDAMAAVSAIHGTEHPVYATATFNAASLFMKMRRYADANSFYQKSLEISHKLVGSSAVVLSERQQIAMSQLSLSRLDGYLSLVFESGRFHREAASEVLRWKGATLVRQRAMRMAAEDPDIADRFRELQEVTRQLASVSRAVGVSDREVWRKRIVALAADKEELEVGLGRDSAVFHQSMQDVSFGQIQAAIPADGVLIDYFQFGRSRPAGQPGIWDTEVSLLALVVRPDGEPRLVELGPVAPLSDAIDTWRASFGMSTEAQAAGRTLRHAIWEPLLDDIAGARTVLVSTDGVLGRLPLGALPGKEPDTYLIEDHRLAMIPVPQLLPALVQHSVGTRTLGQLLLVGDIDYGLNAEGQPRPWERLPETAAEIESLYDLYKQCVDKKGQLITLRGNSASESRIRKELPESHVLHFATHGLFRFDRIPAASLISTFTLAQPATLEPTPFQASEFGDQPKTVTVVRSGLVLAGANRPPEVPDALSDETAGDDGLLMDDEILTLPLQKTDLAVLSACDTAQGEVQSGEGLLGIQRAFQVAGVRTTVASLWKVDDLATQLLMERFHRNLTKPNMTRLDALREAQIELLDSGKQIIREAARRRAPKTGSIAVGESAKKSELPRDEHRLGPYFWAAFVLSGDWR